MRSKETDDNNMCEKRNGKKAHTGKKKIHRIDRYMQGVIKDDGTNDKSMWYQINNR
jgi:hypothetical protein